MQETAYFLLGVHFGWKRNKFSLSMKKEVQGRWCMYCLRCMDWIYFVSNRNEPPKENRQFPAFTNSWDRSLAHLLQNLGLYNPSLVDISEA